MTARITLERIGAGEVRVTVTADIRISGNLGSLLCPHGAPVEGGDRGGQQAGAAVQEFLYVPGLNLVTGNAVDAGDRDVWE